MTHREETEVLLDQWFGDDPCKCACHHGGASEAKSNDSVRREVLRLVFDELEVTKHDRAFVYMLVMHGGDSGRNADWAAAYDFGDAA